MKRIAIIDGNSLINRAYYAMRNPMITKEGIYTHAIFGFINMLDKIRKDYEPEYMAIAFDMKAPTFRHKEYDEYKAGRKKMPPELAMQIPLLKDILDAMNITRIETEGYEADDIIGTIARSSEDQGLEPIIITGDKDQLQLATDVIKVVFTKRGVSDFDLFDEKAFLEKYGFMPLQFIDFKGLAGDSSDNIPGVPGIGEKTATKLIQEYGSVENIISNVENLTPKGVKAKIEENAQLAMMSKRLATIFTQVPIETDISEYEIKEPDYDRLIEIFRKLEFNRFLNKMRVNREPEEETPTVSALVDTSSYKRFMVKTPEELRDIRLEGQAVLKVFGDYSHVRKPLVEGAAIMCGEKYYYFDCAAIGSKTFAEWLAGRDAGFLGHEIKRDYYMLMCGMEGDMPYRAEGNVFNTEFDTAVAQYVLDSGRSNYSLSALSNEYLHESVEDEKEFLASNGQVDMFTDMSANYSDYGFRICTAIMNLSLVQKAEIEGQGLSDVLYNIELPLIEVMASMEYEGFRCDRAFLGDFGTVLDGEISKLTTSIYEYAEEEFNINSPAQLGTVLFEKMGLPHGKKTKKGYSTSADVLEKITGEHPIVPAILEYRTLAKLKSTYVDGLIPLINEEDGKIHAHFQQTVAATGRISCTEPNLQNIPIRQELGRKLRQAFVPENENCMLVAADYSQIELRVLAHMSGDEVLISAFNNGEDIHRATASNVLGIPEDKITIEERSRAKAVNFGVIYGMSGFGLSSELHISRKEADEYIKAYFEKHTAVRSFMDRQIEMCKDLGYVKTMFGRRRHIKEIRATQFMVRQIGERLAMNTPIQGTAADIIKLAMISVYRAINAAGLKSSLILQIHDELVINAYPEEKEQVEKLLVEHMEKACEMAVELKAELNEGDNWYQLK